MRDTRENISVRATTLPSWPAMASRKRTSRLVKRGDPLAVVAHTSPHTSPSTTIGTPMSDSFSRLCSRATARGSASGSSTELK